MPELPEVETTRRGVAPWVEGHRVIDLIIRERRLRWPIPTALKREIRDQTVLSLRRRAKYLLFDTLAGTAIVHLGMSGSLRVLPTGTNPGKHDHVDIALDSGRLIRFNDPRRFGSLLWTRRPPEQHPLLRSLGPEPLGPDFTGLHLHHQARGRKLAIKSFLMTGQIVVGVGNIYASEALFRAGIHPRRAAGRVSLPRMERLAHSVKDVLSEAIAQGGTTLRDFTASDGNPGYFAQELEVYGRQDEPCVQCAKPIRCVVIGQRATYYCTQCQR